MSAAPSSLDRLRQLMVGSAERYSTLRREAPSQPSRDRKSSEWAAMPELSDDTIRAKTGDGWDAWVSRVDAGPGRDAGHAAVAAWIADTHGIDAWWAQSITVGYERISGLRLPGQMPDGTFSISRSKSLTVEWTELEELLDDDDARAVLVPVMKSTRRSKPGVKAPKFSLWDDESGTDLGVVQFRAQRSKNGCTLVVTHNGLHSSADEEIWKGFWAAWLEDLSAADSLNRGE